MRLHGLHDANGPHEASIDLDRGVLGRTETEPWLAVWVAVWGGGGSAIPLNQMSVSHLCNSKVGLYSGRVLLKDLVIMGPCLTLDPLGKPGNNIV